MRHPLLVEVDHPLVRHKLTLLRDQRTIRRDFRAICAELATLLAYEATRALATEPVHVHTPLAPYRGERTTSPGLVAVPILRAGLGMLSGVQAIAPTARVGYVGIRRDERTLVPHVYYQNLSAVTPGSFVLVLDPMLATGGSAMRACDLVKQAGAGSTRLVCLIAASAGVAAMAQHHPDIDIYTAGVDHELDRDGFIRPGLGDAGDRL